MNFGSGKYTYSLVKSWGMVAAGWTWGEIVGLAVETFCRFHRELTFPEIVEVGLRVGKLGNSSVRYEIGIFKKDIVEAAATGHFVHVFVERAARKPVPIPASIRAALERLVV